ncbi:MAG: hypothetical protein CMM30_03915 [Rhodospirillaceae bacterium]|nr:hypothetical protein [Rhodospirillaceae bacterium]|tara:strand:- start:9223 stop:9957 length:735 start_codon:yes stop_codon:yes gene_type:complete
MPPLMPKATAVWLIENTTLTFDQIADFCSLHALEIQGVADGEVAVGIRGMDPVISGQISREEITRCENDASAKLKGIAPPVELPKRSKKARYTPVSKRQERPNGIAWLLKNYPELSDSQIGKLLGTTKTTISTVRDSTHWNTQNISPHDPVLAGICGEAELVNAVNFARRRKARADSKKKNITINSQDVKQTSETIIEKTNNSEIDSKAVKETNSDIASEQPQNKITLENLAEKVFGNQQKQED